MTHPTPSRRRFLQAGAATLSLPWLAAMKPEEPPRRLLLIGRVLGCNQEYFFPEKAGPDYDAPRYLKLLERHRGRFTVISGMSHVGYPNSHHTEAGLFTGVPAARIQRPEDIRNSISLDQVLAERAGPDVRHACLNLGGTNAGSLAYNRKGVPVPGTGRPEMAFRKLFIDGKPEEVQRELRRLADGKSILDGVREQLRTLGAALGTADRARLDGVETSIREAERQLEREQAWAAKPKPKVSAKAEEFRDGSWSRLQKIWYDLAALAFQTDSTRVITIAEGEAGAGASPDTTIGQHDASHHGQEPAKIEQFARFEEEQVRRIGGLLDRLSEIKEGDGSLLDRTIVFWCSNLGNPSAHASNNLPVFVAGGGLKHQGHLAFDRKHNRPLSDLYLRFLQQLGVRADSFGSSVAPVAEL
jgi:hypothetical protein